MNDSIWYYVGVRAKETSWPRVCPCCLGYADSEMRVGGQRNVNTTVLKGGSYIYQATKFTMNVPSCAACNVHRKSWYRFEGWALLAALAIVGASVAAAALRHDGRLLWAIPVAIVAICTAGHFYSRRLLSPQCGCTITPVRPFPQSVMSDVSEFGFLRKEYADLFAASNAANVMERGDTFYKSPGWTKENVTYYGEWAKAFGTGRSAKAS